MSFDGARDWLKAHKQMVVAGTAMAAGGFLLHWALTRDSEKAVPPPQGSGQLTRKQSSISQMEFEFDRFATQHEGQAVLSEASFTTVCRNLEQQYPEMAFLHRDQALRTYLFKSFDNDCNGMVDKAEFTASMMILTASTDREKCTHLFNTLSEDGSAVTLEALQNFLKKDVANKIAMSSVWRSKHGAAAKSPNNASVALASDGGVVGLAMGGLLALLGMRSKNAKLDKQVHDQIKRCAVLRAVELSCRVALYCDDSGKLLDSEQFWAAYQAVLSKLFSIKGLRQQMASWVDESEAQLDTVVALIDNEKDSIGQLSEKEMTQFVRRMANDDTARLDDYPDSKALVGMSIEEAKIYIRTNFAETKCAEIIKAFEPK